MPFYSSKLSLLLTFCLSSLFLSAQDKSDPIIAAQIDQEVWQVFKEAYATNDGERYANLHSEDILRVTKWGIKQNPKFTEDILKNFSREDRKPVTIDFRFEHRIHNEDIGYEVGYYKVSGHKKDGSSYEHYGRFHVVLKMINGRWKITQDWDTGNVNGLAVGAKDFERLDSLALIQKTLLDEKGLHRQRPVVLKTEGTELYQYWEMPNHPILWQSYLGPTPGLTIFKDSLMQRLGAETYWASIQTERRQSPNNTTVKNDSKNYQLVHQGDLGQIRPIQFIEAEVLNYQLERYPLLSHPTEFHCFISQHDSLDLVRVYFAASDQGWPPKPKPIVEHLETSLKNGWKLTKHLHNHYEDPGDNYLGVMAPSKPDAQYFKMLRDRFQVQEALITNGFTTVVLRPEEFDDFESH